MLKLNMLLLLFVVSCNFSTKDKGGSTKTPLSPNNSPAVELVTESFTVQKKDNFAISAFSQKSITPTHIKVVKELTPNEVLFRISQLPLQGLLTLDDVPVLINQDISQTDLNRGALKYTHSGLPGTDGFKFIAWNKDSMATENSFDLLVNTPIDRACSDNNGYGMQSWDETDFGLCNLSSCEAGFYLDGNSCLPQICTPNTNQSCSILNGSGTETCNAQGSGFSSCSLGSCDAGYHSFNGVCELDVAPCSVANGSGTQTWNGSSYDACIVSSCATGFYTTGSQCLPQVCTPNSTASCSITNGSGSQTCNLLGSSYDACSVSSCNAGYQINGNSCEAIPVACNYASIPSPMYENNTYNIPSPVTQGHALQYQMTLVSGVTLNSSTGALTVVPSVQDYNFNVQAYNDTGSALCNVSFSVTKSLIANNDSKATTQGEALVIPVAELTTNDQSLASRTFTLTSVGNAVGGSVTLSSGNITFTPSAFAGDDASFEYTITDSSGTTDVGVVDITIEALPQLDALIYDADQMTEMMALLNTAPPTMQDMFDSWARFEANNYYANKAAASGDALAWQFLENPDRVVSTVNSMNYIGFISPEKLDNYIFETDVSSTDYDDDAVALLVAFVRSGGNNYTLSAVRTQGGAFTGITQGWALVYNYRQGSQVVVEQKNVGGVFPNNGQNGWSGRSSRLRVHRTGDSIKIWASNWNSTNIDDSSLIELDLNSHSRYYVFKGKQSYGFAAHSQKDSTFMNISLQGGSNLDNNVIYDLDNQQVWRYTEGSGWALSGEDFAESLGYPRVIYNPSTDQSYNIDRYGVVTILP